MFAYFDIGGTNTRVAVSEDGTSFAEPQKFSTPKSFDELMATIAETARTQANGKPFTAAGGGVAGPLDANKIILGGVPNVPDEWVGHSVQDELGQALDTQVFLENDSVMVGLGEALHGAGKGDAIMVYITVSTGLGGARIVNGEPDVNVFGFEPGHQYIDIDHSECAECESGKIIDYCSGLATTHRFSVEPYEVKDPEVWEQLARWLAYMLNNTIVHWSPHSVVLGGSMIVGDPAIPIDRVEHHLNEICTVFREKPVIKKATLDSFGGLYGAMSYVAKRLEK